MRNFDPRGLYYRVCTKNYASFDDTPDDILRQAAEDEG
jgi:hypothetical protein